MAAATNGIQAKPHFYVHQDVPKKRRGFARARSLSWLLGKPPKDDPNPYGHLREMLSGGENTFNGDVLQMDCNPVAITYGI